MSRFTLFLIFLFLTLLFLSFTHALTDTDAEQQQITDTQTLEQHIESHFTNDATTEQEVEQSMDGEMEADVDVDADTEESSLVETEAETEAETEVDTEQDMEAETDAELDAATLLQIDTVLDAEAEAELDTEVDIESAQVITAMNEADTQADIESETEMDAEMDALTTIDNEIDMDAEIQADLTAEAETTTTTLLEMENEGQEELDADEIALLETEMESEQDADLDSNTQLLADANFEKKYKHSKAALRYLRALSEAGTLRSAKRLDRSLRQHGFLARFRNPETQICHGSMKSFQSRQATSFYGYEEKFCEAVTAQQYVDKKSHVGLNPQIKHFRAPHRTLFAYTEHRQTFLNSLYLINQKNGWTANWQASQATVAKKSAAVQALFAFCDFQRKYKHYPNKYAGYIERIPLDKNWLLGAAVTGVYMQNPNIQITMPILAKYLEDAVALATTMNAREKRQFQKWIKMVAISPVSGDVQDQFAHVPNFVAGYVMEVGTCDALGTSFEDKNLTSWSPTQLDTVFQKAVSGFFSIGRRPAHLEPLVLDYLSYHLYHKTLARAGTLSPFIIRRGLKKGIRGAIQKLTRKLTPKRLEKRRYNRAIRAIRKRNLKLLRKVARSIRRAPLLDKQQKKNLRSTLKTLIVLVKKGFKLTIADVVNVRKLARQLYRQFLGIVRGVKPKPRPTKPSSTTSAPTTPSTPTTVIPTTTSAPTTATVTTPPTTPSASTTTPPVTTTSPPTVPVTVAPTTTTTVPTTPSPTTNAPTYPSIPIGGNSTIVIGTDPNIPSAPILPV